MVLKAFSIYDEKSVAFMQPFFMPQIGQALRAFSDVVKDQSKDISKHAGDYKLYQVGEFDDNSGLFTSENEKPKFLANALDFVEVLK